ncbi:MAG: hypothetical protein Tsb0021_18520 [Chlamydiales bacterium]
MNSKPVSLMKDNNKKAKDKQSGRYFRKVLPGGSRAYYDTETGKTFCIIHGVKFNIEFEVGNAPKQEDKKEDK